mmetsp:Transcript_26421/g.45127  ORF Transcript_26421/g.45127 Transcript_26421/m.45127 type:complete len:274 (+) Transcript_26421:105-926(+)
MTCVAIVCSLLASLPHVVSLNIAWGQSSLPLRTLRAPFGDDSVGLSENGKRALVVDGLGVTNGLFARQLGQHLSNGHKDAISDVVEALRSMANRGLSGAATFACVDVGAQDILVTSLGNCEVALLRRGAHGHCSLEDPSCPWSVVFRSGHYSSFSAPTVATISSKGIVVHPELARATKTCRVSVRPGDVVLLGNDGFFKCLSDREVADLISQADLEVSTSSPTKPFFYYWPRWFRKGNRAIFGRRLALQLARAAKAKSVLPGDISAVAGLVMP